MNEGISDSLPAKGLVMAEVPIETNKSTLLSS